MIRLLHVVGARPNFMKAAPVLAAARAWPHLHQTLVHTGQHYDAQMSGAYFDELGLPHPDENLGVGSGSHAVQTARIMLAFEPVLERHRPDWVVVYGDVNSTIACALVAAKCGIRVGHVEAGLRSGDRGMPEELNRILTDQLADVLFTPSRDGDLNLRAEGISPEKIQFVGNVMVDTLLRLVDVARTRRTPESLGLVTGRYVLVTLHRPSNVDHPEVLKELLATLEAIAQRLPVVFAVHPRTQHRLAEFGLAGAAPSVRFVEPLPYLATIGLADGAAAVVTDSGGLQEETTVLGVPCLTVRPSTERPVTITQGTNQLVAPHGGAILPMLDEVLARRAGGGYQPHRPEGWDGQASTRIATWFARFGGVPTGTEIVDLGLSERAVR